MLWQRSLLRPRRQAEREAARRPSCQRRWPAALALAALAALVLSRSPRGPAATDGAGASGQAVVSAAAVSGSAAAVSGAAAAVSGAAASGAPAAGRGLAWRRRARRRRRGGGPRRKHGATAAAAGAATATAAGTTAGGGGGGGAVAASARPDLLLLLTDSFDGRLLDPASALSRAVALPH